MTISIPREITGLWKDMPLFPDRIFISLPVNVKIYFCLKAT